MSNLSFVLWVTLYPLSISITRYLSEYAINNDIAFAISEIIGFMFYAYIAIKLYRKKGED